MTIITRYTPFFQPVPQLGMITRQNDDEIWPTFREYLASVPVEDDSAISHYRIQFVEELLQSLDRS